MTINPTPTDTDPKYHVSLSDGTTTIGLVLCDMNGKKNLRSFKPVPVPRSVLKTFTGNTKYSDDTPGYTTIAQDDWSGGRGQEDFEANTTRFFDSYRADTTKGDIIPGPLETETTGYFDYTAFETVSDGYTVTATLETRWASDITPASTISCRRFDVKIKGIKKTSVYPFTLTGEIYTDSSGPNALVSATTVAPVVISSLPTKDYTIVSFNFPAVSLTSGTKYWISVKASAGAKFIFARNTAAASSIYTKTTGSWSSAVAGKKLVSRFFSSAQGEAIFFEYRNLEYFCLKSDDYQAPKLFYNGYRGLVRTTSADNTITKTSLTLTLNELSGKIIKVIAGPGSKESINWRLIVSNTAGANADIVVSPAWKVAQTVATDFVILGCNTWTEVSTTPAYTTLLKYPITDVCTTDDIVYFAQGEEQSDSYICKMKWGSGAHSFAKDGSNTKATYLASWYDASGTQKIARSYNNCSVAVSSKIVWTGNLGWGAAVDTGDDSRITNLATFGRPDNLWVLKEGEFGIVESNKYKKMSPNEYRSMLSEQNGQAWLSHDVYLYFTFLDGMERFYQQHLDDKGPNRDEGMTGDRKGTIKHFVGYAGRFYAAYDALDTGYSCVFCYTPGTDGFHEIYRAPMGERIRRLGIQVMPGDTVDRMWVSQEERIVWLPVALNPRKQSGYTYFSGSEVVSSWIDAERIDVVKIFKQIKAQTEKLNTTHQYVTFEYQTDSEESDDDWHDCATTIDTSPIDETSLANIRGKRFRYRVTLYTNDSTKYARVRAISMDVKTIEPLRWSYAMTLKAQDEPKDTQGDDATYEISGVPTALTRLETFTDILNAWAAAGTPLTMCTRFSNHNNKTVTIDPPLSNPIKNIPDDQFEKHVYQLTAMEI
jgi:hypothetical protein